MRTKAQGFVSSVKWVEETYGKAALQEVVRACSPEVRARIASAIAIEWIPVREVVEVTTHVNRILGTGTGKLAESIGEVGARASIRSPMLRFVFYVGRPEFLMRKCASFWRQYNDAGEMLVRSFEANNATFELTGADETYAIFCGSSRDGSASSRERPASRWRTCATPSVAPGPTRGASGRSGGPGSRMGPRRPSPRSPATEERPHINNGEREVTSSPLAVPRPPVPVRVASRGPSPSLRRCREYSNGSAMRSSRRPSIWERREDARRRS